MNIRIGDVVYKRPFWTHPMRIVRTWGESETTEQAKAECYANENEDHTANCPVTKIRAVRGEE